MHPIRRKETITLLFPGDHVVNVQAGGALTLTAEVRTPPQVVQRTTLLPREIIQERKDSVFSHASLNMAADMGEKKKQIQTAEKSEELFLDCSVAHI